MAPTGGLTLMRIGVLADIHEQHDHLRQAVQRLRAERVDRFVVLGDVADRGGPALEATAALLVEIGAVGVFGNHELGLCVAPRAETLAPYSETVRAFLAGLQPRLELGGALFCHIEPWRDPTDAASYYEAGPPRDAERARQTFETALRPIVLIGHYHEWIAFDRNGQLAWDPARLLRLRPDERYLVVVHAVRDGWCALLDTDLGTLQAIRLGPSAISLARDPAGAIRAALEELPSDAKGVDEVVERLVTRYPPDPLREALAGCFGDLRGTRGEVLLRLAEAVGSRGLIERLAEALEAQPDLPPDRAWEALALVRSEPTVLAAHAELEERLDELDALFEDDAASLAELAAEIEADPECALIAFDGLRAIEPELRVAILAGLAEQGHGPRLAAFLERLAEVDDPMSSRAARGALRRLAGAEVRPRETLPAPNEPRLIGSVVTALDGRGQGWIVLAAEDRGEFVGAAFGCDVLGGIVAVEGRVGADAAPVRALLAAFAARPERDVVENANDLALNLLGGCLWAGGGRPSGVIAPWLERTVGSTLVPRPVRLREVAAPTGAVDVPAHSRAVLEGCDAWVDDSDLTRELAAELLLRQGATCPEDGACRFLFERVLQHRVELDRRILCWMSAFWEAANAPELAHAAAVLEGQLQDAQNLVPGHPFFVTLAVKSLTAAQERLRLRDETPTVRATDRRG